MIDVATSNELDDALRQIDHVFNAISLLGEAETTPPHVMSGLADVGGTLAKAALDRLRTVPTRPGQTEYTANAAPN
jgi:hypothetical protein